MPRIEEAIPEALAIEAEAARAWFSAERGTEFELTGIVDPDEVASDGRRELQLILCGNEAGQDVCLREGFEVTPSDGRFIVRHLAEPVAEIGSPAPLLDPPAGVRKGWLDSTLAKHAFVVLVFYRGFW